MIKEITEKEFNALLQQPVPGRYLTHQSEIGQWKALQIDFKGNIRRHSTSFKKFAIGWLKR